MIVKNNQKTARGANRKAGNEPKLTPDQERHELAKQLGLRPKSKQVLDLLIENPKLTQSDAYAMVHKTTNKNTIAKGASELVNKPNALIYKQSAIGKAKRRIVQLVESGNESIALKASQDIIDRTSGKAIQRSENTSQVIEVKLDLSGKRIGTHYINMPQVPVLDQK